MRAVVMVHWPGKDTPACVSHAAKLMQLASVMGFAVSSTPIEAVEVECTNCANEAKKAAAAPA